MKHQFTKGDIYTHNHIDFYIYTGQEVEYSSGSFGFICECINSTIKQRPGGFFYEDRFSRKKWRKKYSGVYLHTSDPANMSNTYIICNYFKLKQKKKILQMLGSEDISIVNYALDCIKYKTIK
jgi:hypothetical protein